MVILARGVRTTEQRGGSSQADISAATQPKYQPTDNCPSLGRQKGKDHAQGVWALIVLNEVQHLTGLYTARRNQWYGYGPKRLPLKA
jgi:hypothetical protein